MLILLSGLGLVVGSFINAAVYRLQFSVAREGKKPLNRKPSTVNLSLWSGRSMCPRCRHQLAAADLVPVLSWLWLKGKCRYCKAPISPQYPLVELLTALLFALSYHSLQPTNYQLVVWLVLLTMLLIMAIYDLHHYILPDKVMLPAIVVAIGYRLWVIVYGLATHHSLPTTHYNLLSPFLAAVLAGGAFYAIAAVSNGKWMGGGDIKLAFLMGLILGLPKTGVAMLVAFNLAAVIGIALIMLKIKKRTDHIPFGPFLVLGTIVAQLYGQPLIDWYLRLLGV